MDSIKKQVKNIFSELIGAELVDETATSMTFRILVDPSKITPDSLMRRALTLTTTIQRDAIKSLVEKNLDLAAEVSSRGDEAVRLYRLMIRQLSLAVRNLGLAKELDLESVPDNLLRAVGARDMSRLAYHAVSIAKQALNLKGYDFDKTIMDDLMRMSNTVYDMQKQSYQAFFKEDFRLAYEVVKTMGKVSEIYDKLLLAILSKKMPVAAAVGLSMVLLDIRRIAGYTVAISDVVLTRHFVKP